ncbi:MAG TPA: HaeII family restriction endonuclease [Pyrinomonadaceae bacterium]|nr:HaeII family restriction endonuclease [Pyrinomonadaceae bacterium]
MSDEERCRAEVDRMLKNSQTKVIFPILTLALLREYSNSGKTIFSDSEIRKLYEKTVKNIGEYFGHDMHIGGKYYDAYPSRNLPRYGVLRSIGKSQYELLSPYTQVAALLCEWIPGRVKQHIVERLGVIPRLADHKFRAKLSADRDQFLQVVSQHIIKNPINFEIFSFAVIKVHLEKFACKIYRDTRTSAHDRGVDLSTNFGVVYQIKKLKIYNQAAAKNIYAELKVNFDSERLQDGNVILVIDDISKEVKNYLINMKVQTISKDDLLKLASQFEDMEDREKVLRIVHDEFRREYSSSIK